jgi:hypothetical protein
MINLTTFLQSNIHLYICYNGLVSYNTDVHVADGTTHVVKPP